MKKQEVQIMELKQALLRANEDIEKLSKIRSDFVSIISHELRTPLTSIKESISLVLEGVAGPIGDDQKKFLSMAKKNIDRLAKLVVDVLDFSKLDSGRITMHKKKADINKVINDVYVEIKEDIEKKKIDFNIELSDGIEQAWFDPKRIAQALKHLISNAIKFNREKGKITIVSSNGNIDGKEVIRVSVEDTGIGISRELIPELFKEYNPLDTSMTRKHTGLGLGLSICKRIVDYHAGDIWVESEEGKGSKFIFTLPIYKRDNEFNFLLDGAIERARYAELELALIVFSINKKKDNSEENLASLEEAMKTTVRGPEDKVARFKDGKLLAMMVGTNRCGVKSILERLKKRINVPLNYGIAVYPGEAENKESLIKQSEKDLKGKKITFRQEVEDGKEKDTSC